MNFDIDKTPVNSEQVNELLEIVAAQAKEVVLMVRVKVTCPCGRRVSVYYHTYRCFYCGVYFCKKCAKRHFGIVHNCQHGKGKWEKRNGC